jgi:cold shock protein
MAKGTVRWFNPTTYYGFLIPYEEGAPDVFIHGSELEKAHIPGLKENQELEFDIVLSREGKPKAVNVRLTEF